MNQLRAGLLFAACAAMFSAAHAQEVTGAGASFPAPVYAKWADAYNKATGVRINYQSVGSGAGIKQIQAKTVDFGASDAPLKDEQLAKDGLVQFPTVIGGVVPVINVKGINPGQLKLDGKVLADIYLGKVNAEWKDKVGEGTAVNWPTGAGGKGNEGVSAFVTRLPNSIGYVEYAYAKQNKMTYVLMKNASGAFVSPSDDAFKAAAAGAKWDQSFYQVLTEQAGKDSWPITGATFILMHVAQDKPAQAAAALKFFDWAYTQGDKMADDLDYVPLPASVKDLVRKQWAASVKDGSGKAVSFK